MARRNFQQMSLVDQFYNIRPKRSAHLDAISKCIDWGAVQKLLSGICASIEGAASYPILCYVRILLLQQWYGLSDREAELSIEDSLSFRRFAGIPLEEKVPDHTRIWAFRQKLAELGLDKALFEEINRQIEAQGLFVKKGTLIDATIIPAAAKAPKGDDGALSDVDPGAGWTKKNGVSTYGYKGHVGVDEGTDLIRAATFTSADVHDSVEFKNLVSGDEEAAGACPRGKAKPRPGGGQGLSQRRAPALSRSARHQGWHHVQGRPRQAFERLAGLVQQGRCTHPRGRGADLRPHEGAARLYPRPVFQSQAQRLRLLPCNFALDTKGPKQGHYHA